ncbi:unnamed protein product [Prorocentrum cordatum]|uniref:Uncharacterized protein n=1 Tax=Prorocentrum cordatum TaxID=2364126 RepID=A0ABN9WLA0_9DINO|nr:unnamed protein product [Polarella glacialis]
MALDDRPFAAAAASGGSETPSEPKAAGSPPARAASPAPATEKNKDPKQASRPERTRRHTLAIVVAAIVAAVVGVAGGGCYYLYPSWTKRTLRTIGRSAHVFFNQWTPPREGELTKSTWDDATAGKTVFVKFHAPW